jgi:cyd operon protein YbgT
MWYFTWVLGLGLAASFSIMNAMWYEVMASQHENATRDSDQS